jgi:MFS family permease
MSDRIRSSRRLIIIGAALLGAAAVAIVLGVVPPIRSDTFPLAAPSSAAAGFMVQAGIAVLLALALAIVAIRVTDRPRVTINILYLIGALVFLLGIPLAGLAPAFLVHGPSLHAAIFIMFVSGAAEFAAAGLVVAAASRLPGPATSGDTSAWKMRIAPAALLGIGSFFLMFLLGEGIKIPASVPAAEYVGGLLIVIALGGYSLLATYVDSRGLPRAKRNLWIVFAMNAVLLLAGLIVLLTEPNNPAALEVLGIAVITSACSYGGQLLATRSTHPHMSRHKPAGHQAS